VINEYIALGFIKKIASKQNKKNQKPSRKRIAGSLVGGTVMTGVGLNQSDQILGYKNVYHGTSKKNWENIKRVGLDPSLGGKMSDRGVSAGKRMEDMIRRQSAGKVHVSPLKFIANDFARRGHRPATIENVERASRVLQNPAAKPYQIRRATNVIFQETYNMFIGKGGKTMKINLDYDKWKRMEADPLLLRNYVSKNIAARGTEAIHPVEIRGSNAKLLSKIRHRMKKLPSYIRNNPGRFSKGIAKALLAGTLGYAGIRSGIKAIQARRAYDKKDH
jgi:hypothetical protein